MIPITAAGIRITTASQKSSSEARGRNRPRVFVCLSTDWDGHPSTMTHLFRVIARRERVIWINSMGQRAPRFTAYDLQRLVKKGACAWWARKPAERRDDGPKAVLEPRVLPFHHYEAVRRLNSRLLLRQLQPHLARWRDRDAQLILLSSNPAAVDLIAALQPDLAAYYCLDEYAEMPDADTDLIRVCEPKMLEAVDMTFATSANLCQAKRGAGYESIYLPQGVDYAHFQDPGPCPEPMRNLPRPIVGFQGIVGNRVDLTLLEKIARRFPQASLVALGKKEVDLSRLTKYPNFRHFSGVPYAELPRWASRFDIGLVAYRMDGHTASVNPLKLLEYLAMGQAVVSVDLPELARHGEFIAVGRDHDQYLNALSRLIRRFPFSEEEQRQRRAYARNESWERRAEQLLDACNLLLDKKRSEGTTEHREMGKTGDRLPQVVRGGGNNTERSQ